MSHKELLYRQLISWVVDPFTWDRRDMVIQLVDPDIFDIEQYKKIYKCVTSDFDVVKHEFDPKTDGVLLADCRLFMDNQEYYYKPLNEETLRGHLQEIQRTKNREKLEQYNDDLAVALQAGEDGQEILEKVNKLKSAISIPIGKTAKEIGAAIDAGHYKKISPKSGISVFDNCIDGMHAGHVWAIGAYTGSGKSLMCCDLALNVASQGAKVLFFTMEMSEDQIIKRLRWIDQNKKNIGVDDLNIIIYDGQQTLGSIEIIIKKYSPDLVIIDFIQLIRNQYQKEYEQMTENALEIQRMALQYNTCIVFASQVSNDFAKMQSLASVNYKGSGAIAQVVNFGVIMHRDFDEERKTDDLLVPIKVLVWKNRHGRNETGKNAILTFDREKGIILDKKFDPLDGFDK